LKLQIRLAGGTGEELASLGRWLSDEDELRGKVGVLDRLIGETELGSVSEVLTVALGAGGAGTVLASSLITWLQTRRTKAKIIVQTAERLVIVDIETPARDVAQQLEQILKVGDVD
jgi:Effector Associated Constant Component 1